MKFKKILVAFSLMTVAVLAFGFKPVEKKKKPFSTVWFYYNVGLQSSGPATLAQARDGNNYTFGQFTLPTITSGDNLGAIRIDVNDLLDPNETPDDIVDDIPNITFGSDIYNALAAAHNPDGTWSDVLTGYGVTGVMNKVNP